MGVCQTCPDLLEVCLDLPSRHSLSLSVVIDLQIMTQTRLTDKMEARMSLERNHLKKSPQTQINASRKGVRYNNIA